MMERDQIDISRRGVLKKGAITTGALVFGGTAVTGTAAAGIGDGRVLDYHLNNINYDLERGEVVSNFVHDASPADNDGKWEGTTDDPVVKGPVGNAFEFNGTDNHVNVPEDDSLDIQDELSIAFWFRLDGQSSNNQYPRAVSKGQSTSSNGAYGVFIRDEGGTPDRIGLRFIDTNGNKYDIENTSLDPYNDGMWHHVAVTYSNSNDIGRLYFDNSMETETTVSGDVSIRTTDDNLHLGDGNGERHLNGALDEVRIYNRALSDAEITELYEMRD